MDDSTMKASRDAASTLRTTASPLWSRSRGFTLLEVLITVITVSIGLLGLAALQMNGVKTIQEAYLHSQASFLAYDMAERMRANPEGLSGYLIDVDDAVTAATCNVDACSATDMADADVYEWRSLLSNLLGSDGTGAIAISGSDAVVTVQWSIYGETQTFELAVEL